MAQVRTAERGTPVSVTTIIASALAAVGLSGIVALSALGPIDFGFVNGPTGARPEVLEAGRQWELERRQQSGYVDPVLDSGREWERQRRLMSGAS